MDAICWVVVGITILTDNFAGVRYINPVDAKRERAGMTSEVSDGEAVIILLPVHRHRDNPSLVPIDDMPSAGPADWDIATQAKVFEVVRNHSTAVDYDG